MSRDENEPITLQHGPFSWSELCGCLLVYVSVSCCILRKWLPTSLLLQSLSLSHLTALCPENLSPMLRVKGMLSDGIMGVRL